MFIYGIFDGTLSGSDVGASNLFTITNDCGRTKKDPIYPNLIYRSAICLQGLRKITTVLLFSNHENGFDLVVMASGDVRSPTAYDRLLIYSN